MSAALSKFFDKEERRENHYRGPYKRDYSDMIVGLVDSPIYDQAQMQAINDGIVQNIMQKMDSQGLKTSDLAKRSTVPLCTLSKILNYKCSISLKTLIKLAFALGESPINLFPYDLNRRKTNGDRFEEITRGMDVSSVNYLLEQAAGFSRLRHIIKK
ncbi:hypothetical protein ACTQ56_00660 [[Clostridium] aminophilum]|uniref:hypothetical protein n=1 Tax=[Clostridium] aminophilum TaxID=1526 RepID=UPI003F968171